MPQFRGGIGFSLWGRAKLDSAAFPMYDSVSRLHIEYFGVPKTKGHGTSASSPTHAR